MVIFGVDIRIYFLLFVIYSILGWILEVVGKLIECKRFIDRGFLIGPYCPIYGVGALLMTFLLNKYTEDPITLFIMAILVSGILEYFTSYFMEKVYHARWWDYSRRKFNINGRVCLYTIIPFGIFGLLIMYVLNPFFISKIEILPDMLLNILFWVLLIIYLVDIIISANIVNYVRKTTKELGKNLDNTEEITSKVKEILTGKSRAYRRLLKAYPQLQSIKVKIKQKSEKIKKQVIEQQQEIKQNMEKQKKQIKGAIDNYKKNLKGRLNEYKNY